MEQVIQLTGRVAEVLQVQSGTSQRTGNSWQSQEFIFEYFAWSGQQNATKICCRIFGEENITKFNVKPLEEITVYLSISANKSENGRWFNEVRCTNVWRGNQPQP